MHIFALQVVVFFACRHFTAAIKMDALAAVHAGHDACNFLHAILQQSMHWAGRPNMKLPNCCLCRAKLVIAALDLRTNRSCICVCLLIQSKLYCIVTA